MRATIAFRIETSRRGVFAVGDVRSGSVKRVASSVGDGAQVVAAIHSYLANSVPQAEPDHQQRGCHRLIGPAKVRPKQPEQNADGQSRSR